MKKKETLNRARELSNSIDNLQKILSDEEVAELREKTWEIIDILKKAVAIDTVRAMKNRVPINVLKTYQEANIKNSGNY